MLRVPEFLKHISNRVRKPTQSNIIIFDAEIKHGTIPLSLRQQADDLKYCNGWKDYVGMEVSVVCVYDYKFDRFITFEDDDAESLQHLIDSRDIVVGFNSENFDNPLLNTNWGTEIPREKHYDLLQQIWAAAGLSPKYHASTHIGYSLRACCEANFLSFPEVLGVKEVAAAWQRGNREAVYEHCRLDVMRTRALLDICLTHEQLFMSPVQEGRVLSIVSPLKWSHDDDCKDNRRINQRMAVA